MMVVDASVVVKMFVREQGDVAARQLLLRHQSFIAPDFVILETANVLRRKCKCGEMTVTQYRSVAGALHHYFGQLISAATLVQDAVELAVTLDHDVYDCAYLACAIQRSLQLTTADQVFAGKAASKGFQAHVVVL